MPLLIKNGRILNPNRPDKPQSPQKADILIENDRITKISEDNHLKNNCSDVVDADNCIIIPGLINLHTHITRRHLHRQSISIPFRHGAPEIENSPITKRILWALKNAWLELGDGVTTIRDAGSKGCVSIDLRNSISEGIFDGPLIIASGEPVAMTGGHESHRYHAAREADGPDEVRKAVREQLRAGADWIKLMASGGIGGMPYREHPSMMEFSEEELRAGTEEAHKRHRRVMVHAMSDESIIAAITVGVDCIEHGVLMSDNTLGMMKEKQRNFVPTMSGIYKVFEREKAAGNDSFADLLLTEVVRKQMDVVTKAVRAGILIGTGSDTLGSVYEEIRLLIECGLSRADALAAATINGAKILGLDREIGTIEEGKRADMVLLEANPLDYPEAYRQIREVIFAGKRLSSIFPQALFVKNHQGI